MYLDKVWVEDDKDIDDIQGQKEAKLKGRTWGVPIMGAVRIVDNTTGKVVDQKASTNLGILPKITRRYSYVVDGSEWQIPNQFRLKSGVYTRKKANGEITSQWNLAKGLGFDMDFAPESGKMTLGYKSSNIPLYPVLHLLGISDEAIQSKWSKSLLEANKLPEPKMEAALRSLHKKLVDKPAATIEEVKKQILDELKKTELRPESTKETLGTEHSSVTGSALLHGSEKLLSVHRGESQPDDRDNLAFKDFLSAGDLLHERLSKRLRWDVQRKFANRLNKFQEPTVDRVVSPDLFGLPIKTFFTNAQITERPTQLNPLNFIGLHRRTTLGGEGGISGEHTITLEAQSINPSQFAFLDPIQTPESGKIGTILQMASGARKVGQEIRAPAYNTKTGKLEWINPATANRSIVAFPDQYDWKDGKPVPRTRDIKVMDENNELTVVPPSKVQYVLRSAKGLHDIAANMIPFLQNNQGNRTMVAAKQQEQAVPLVHREEPLVQTRGESGETYERALGEFNAHLTPLDGEVVKVARTGITIKGAGGKRHVVQLYDDFPLNDNKGVLNSTPIVKVGDKVKTGQVVADTNFTRNGTLALGTNLNVVYTPFEGFNFEDGIVISSSAAKKLTSEHMLRHNATADENTILNKKRYLAETGGQLSKKQADKLDEYGVIKEGAVVEPGDVVIAKLKKDEPTADRQQFRTLSSSVFRGVSARPEVWDTDYSGRVVRVVRSGKETTVYVRAETPAVVGDKIVGRHGNKGIVTRIIEDEHMPVTKDGVHAEVILNPTGLPTRINMGQALETAAAKIANKTGKPYVVNNFDPDVHDYTRKVMADLDKHGLSDEEDFFDPKTGRRMGRGLFGKQYILKLHHTAEKGLSARWRGSYDLNFTPKGGGEESGQTMDVGGLYALLAHGAHENIQEMQGIKSDKNDEFWTRLQLGHDVPAPKVPFVYKKFESYLRGMGIDINKNGSKIHLGPLTDDQTKKLSSGEIQRPDLGLKNTTKSEAVPEKGGIFDPKVTGTTSIIGEGLGKNWAHVTLAARMPNPTFERPIRVLLGLSERAFGSIVAGEQQLNGKTGPEAIAEALAQLDRDKELRAVRDKLPKLKGQKLSDATKRVKYLSALQKLNMTPERAYTMKLLPIIPPVMRPPAVMENGTVRTDDITDIYTKIGVVNETIKKLRQDIHLIGEDDEDLRATHASLYDGLKSLMLTGMSFHGRHRKGFAELIGGGGESKRSPKDSFFQDKVIGKRQDLSMRGVIVPEPSLGLDEVMIPQKAAQEMYKPFVIKRLVQGGMTPGQAKAEIRQSSAAAVRALELELEGRPLFLKRDPVLHKYGVQAFMPKLTKERTTKIHPLATSGYNADFDGDKMSAYVPISDKAVAEAFRMLPSKNLFSSSHGGLMFAPSQESMQGLYDLSKMGKETSLRFKTAADAAKALGRGEITPHDVIHVDDPHELVPVEHNPLTPSYMQKHAAAPTRTTVGRILIAQALPESMRDHKVLSDPSFIFDKSTLKGVLTDVGKNKSSVEFARTADTLKDLGNSWATGFSFGLKDLLSETEVRNRVLAEAKQKEKKIRQSVRDPKARNDKIVELYGKADEVIQKAVKEKYDQSNNRMYAWIKSGARGSQSQFADMVVGPLLVVDSRGNTVPVPIDKSYSEGLDTAGYFTSMHGARMGTIGRVKGTSEPGALTKEMMQTSMDQMVTSADCGTTNGISMDIDDKHALNRVLAQDVTIAQRGGQDKGVIRRGTVIDPAIRDRLMRNKVNRVIVRSPLRCEEPHGICATCFGINEHGNMHSNGVNLGVLAAHALGEPLTQLAMNAFHQGGRAGAKGSNVANHFERVEQLVEFPKTLPGSATLAKAEGSVERIQVDKDSGGFNVFIDGRRHFIPNDRGRPTIKVGEKVQRGQPLSDGPINPRELLPLAGHAAVQNYLVDELTKAYGGVSNLHRRNTEVFIRALTNLAEVDDPGGNPEYLRGDRAPLTVLSAWNAKEGKGKKPIEYTPVLKGTNVLPNERMTDWMARLQFQSLKKTITEAAAHGWASDIHGLHPIPAMAYGAEFGKGTPDARWKY